VKHGTSNASTDAGSGSSFAEAVLAVVRAKAAPRDCRDLAEVRTGTMRLTLAEAYRLLVEQPGALYVRLGNQQLDLLPAQTGAAKYVRVLPMDSPEDPLLTLPEAADD
jgi:hypothetical protein